MQANLTYIGYILIFFTVLFFLKEDFLYKLTIFAVPFTATSVLNFTNPAHPFGVQVIFFVGSMWMVRRALPILFKPRLYFDRFLLDYLIFAGVILFFCLLSVVCYIFLIQDSELKIVEPDWLNFIIPGGPARMFMQVLYLFFGLMLSFCIAKKNDNILILMSTIKIVLISTIFVIIWGIMQFLLYYINVPYPSFVFNNSSSIGAMGYKAVMETLHFQRVSSVAVEPSILGLYLMIPMSLLLSAHSMRHFIFSKSKDLVIMLSVILIIFMTLSSSAILAAFFLILLFLIYGFFLKTKVNDVAIFFVLFLLIAVCFIFFSPYANEYFQHSIVHKMGTFSGMQRWASIAMGWDLFLQYPLLGHGWGSVTSYDLVVNLLVNGGLLVFCAFLALFLWMIYCQHMALFKIFKKEKNNDKKFLVFSTVLILLTMIFYNSITGFAYVYSIIWFALGFCLAVSRLILKDCQSLDYLNSRNDTL